MALPIAQIVIGAIYLEDCPRQPYIPIYLVVIGVFGLLQCLYSCWKRDIYLVMISGFVFLILMPSRTLNFLVSCFLSCWFIAGNVWIYSIYEPNYNQATTGVDPYCHKTLYLFAFWTTNLVYILIGLSLFKAYCAMFLCFSVSSCSQASREVVV